MYLPFAISVPWQAVVHMFLEHPAQNLQEPGVSKRTLSSKYQICELFLLIAAFFFFKRESRRGAEGKEET